MKIVIEYNFPTTGEINPVQEMKTFLTAKDNEIRKAFNGNEPGEIGGTTPGGVTCNAMLITQEIGEMNGGTNQGNQGNQVNQGTNRKRTTAGQD